MFRKLTQKYEFNKIEKELKKKIYEYGLKRVEGQILSLLKPEIKINRLSSSKEIKYGISKIGGYPDIPCDYKWPFKNEVPLSFIMQIALADLKNITLDIKLPTDGMMFFFYDSKSQPWGFDPKDKGSWEIVYVENIHNNADYNNEMFSIKGLEIYNESKLMFEERFGLPSWESVEVDRLELTKEEVYNYIELQSVFDQLNYGEDWKIKIGGYPNQIQGEMQLECELVSNGIYCGDSSGYMNPRREELEKNAYEWRLLLQINSNEKQGMMWGDEGNLFFWIKEGDLENLLFDKSWLVLQC